MKAQASTELQQPNQEASPGTSSAFVELRNVYKSYGENLVVMNDMTLSMRKEDRLVIIGPSGRMKCSPAFE